MAATHTLTYWAQGETGLDHPGTCNPAKCAYVHSIDDESTADLDPGVYKVTGTTSPTFEELGPIEDPASPGEGTEDPDLIYDPIEDRDAYQQAMEQAKGRYDSVEGEVVYEQ